MNVLLVEDERRVADFVERGFKAEGFGVTVARDGQDGLDLGQEGEFDVIVLDLMLPQLHGHEVCEQPRHGGVLTPILMLTAMDELDARVKGLKLGADDYLTKPFAFDELLARLEALVRRAGNFERPTVRIACGALVFDRESMIATCGEERLDLTAKEIAILDLFLGAPGRVFSRQRILSAVWPRFRSPDQRCRRLRRPAAPQARRRPRCPEHRDRARPRLPSGRAPIRRAALTRRPSRVKVVHFATPPTSLLSLQKFGAMGVARCSNP